MRQADLQGRELAGARKMELLKQVGDLWLYIGGLPLHLSYMISLLLLVCVFA